MGRETVIGYFRPEKMVCANSPDESTATTPKNTPTNDINSLSTPQPPQPHLDLNRGLKRRRQPRAERQDNGLLPRGGAGTPHYPPLPDLELLPLGGHLVDLVAEQRLELLQPVPRPSRVAHHGGLVVDGVGGLRNARARAPRGEYWPGGGRGGDEKAINPQASEENSSRKTLETNI